MTGAGCLDRRGWRMAGVGRADRPGRSCLAQEARPTAWVMLPTLARCLAHMVAYMWTIRHAAAGTGETGETAGLGESMSRAQKIAAIPAGSWTKWLVVGFWVVVVVAAFPLAGKLMGAEKNDAKAWLPANAESTKALDVQSHFQSPNIFPAVVVYERASGLTAADRAKAAADARSFARIHGVVAGQVTGPIPAADGKAIQTILAVNLGKQGWNGAAAAADSIRAITSSSANGLASHITGPLGYAADNSKVFKGIDSTLLYSTLAVVILILLISYRSPLLWLLPVISAGVALTTAEAVIYLLAAHAGLTVNAQSAGILYVLVFG